MDIYSAQNQLKKIRRYANELSQSNRTLYGKSRIKLRSLIDDCESIAAILSDILNDPYTDNPDDEFNSSDTVTTAQRKEIFAKYKQVIRDTSVRCEIGSAKECAELIWYWFDNRFIKSVEYCPDFRYSMYKLPIWISAIVIRFGTELLLNSHHQFIADVKDWCDNLIVDRYSARFPLPYSVYTVISSPAASDANLPSVVLWDVLLDSGYDALVDLSVPGMYLSEDSIYQFCARYNPAELDNYRRYTYDEAILNIINIGGDL